MFNSFNDFSSSFEFFFFIVRVKLSNVKTNNLVLFTARVPDTSNTSATRAIRMQHECYTNDTGATRVLHQRHECDTSEKF